MTWHELYVLAAESGVKTWEADAISPQELYVNIEGYHRGLRVHWEIARETWMYIIRFGNVDPKSAPRRVQDVRVFPWDKPFEESEDDDPMKQALDQLRLQAEKQRELNNGS